MRYRFEKGYEYQGWEFYIHPITLREYVPRELREQAEVLEEHRLARRFDWRPSVPPTQINSIKPAAHRQFDADAMWKLIKKVRDR